MFENTFFRIFIHSHLSIIKPHCAGFDIFNEISFFLWCIHCLKRDSCNRENDKQAYSLTIRNSQKSVYKKNDCRFNCS